VEFWQQHAEVVADGKVLGQVGIVFPAVLERFGIRQPVAMFGFNLQVLLGMDQPVLTFKAIPEFPSSERHLSLGVAKDLPWSKINEVVVGFHPLIKSVEFLSAFHSSTLPAGKKSITCRIEFRADDRTLASEEVDGIMQKLVDKLREELSATMR